MLLNKTKNATKFKREVTMPEFENREDKSASENAKALKHIFKSKMKSMKEEKWKDKALHGQYPRILEKPHVDTVTTNKWLSSNLKGETEALLVAAQDQAINTSNYQKVICGQQVESKCRMCSQHGETVDLIDPCGYWCAWYSKEGDGRKHQESVRESYCDRDSKDLHAGICTNPQKGA